MDENQNNIKPQDESVDQAPSPTPTPINDMNAPQALPSQPLNTPPQPIQPTMPQPIASTQFGQAQPQQDATPQANPPVNAGVIVLQWLTYAFWGWTILAMSWLTSMVYTSFLTDQDIGSSAAYSIASVLILMPISVIVENIYRKNEPVKKTGPASIVMVIHAVLFSLFGIGAVITAAFFLVSMITTAGDSEFQIVGLLSALTISIFYAAALLRTLNPQKIKNVPKLFNIFTISTIGIICLLGIFGPIAQEARTKNDKLIRDNLSTVTRAISSYSQSNNKLPGSLSDLSNLQSSAKPLIENNLLRYTPNIKPASRISSSGFYGNSGTQTFYYEICVTFTEEKVSKYNYDSFSDDEYSYTFNVSSHPKGESCQKLSTDRY
jgi:hypothetical protein